MEMPCPAAAITTAAVALAPVVIGAPGLVQQLILSHLTLRDKLNLGANCTTLQQDSLAWFGQPVTVGRPSMIGAASLAAWLPGEAPAAISPEVAQGNWRTLCGLTALKRLTLDHCRLQQLPDAASNLTALTHLELISNHEASALAPLSALLQLEHLELDSCGLTAVPAHLSALTRLRHLHLENNRDLVGGWHHLSALPRLQNLILSGIANSADVAAELPELPALTRLSCYNINFANEAVGGWQSLHRLTGLETLSLYSCSIHRLPEVLPHLTALTRLRIINDNLSGLEPLSALQQLRHLELENCRLGAVPEQLSVLTALTWLGLAQNRDLTGGGWEHLLPLTRLRTLTLWSVPRPDGIPPEVAALQDLNPLKILC
ncbi:hypothetical protein CHLNCDRAFT_54895 [Chlorella variabilis]|uniref:Uncharacterized protein n=1 Tax=Chlorella variabilis TaxID=554065 RepID=E1ZR02_CHLVA|nr:hypothetical protein CHLNCDRAFT_54895 [Chlorella variabilis]EFN51879.1 hypothetical protein CHLNCDRAFT_54895 [Chlorella variabilis]|eukprot:XP_005843981.1 hypothetical protein CHLNCDRAFT_54895 [Chlorella variabilis]